MHESYVIQNFRLCAGFKRAEASAGLNIWPDAPASQVMQARIGLTSEAPGKNHRFSKITSRAAIAKKRTEKLRPLGFMAGREDEEDFM